MHHPHILHHLKQCIKSQDPVQGKKLHAHIIKIGLNQSRHGHILPSVLLNMYWKCGQLSSAFQLFDEMPERDLVSWASIFTAYNHSNRSQTSLSLFRTMLSRDGLKPDHFIFASLVNACAHLCYLKVGQQVHAQFLLSSFSHDDVAKSALVDFYAKCGLPDKARRIFDSIRVKTVVSWSALISGFAKSGRKTEAVELVRCMPVKNLYSWTALVSGFVQNSDWFDAFTMFIEMRREGIGPVDPFIMSSIVAAAAGVAALQLGKQVHCLVLLLGYDSDLFVSNALVDMYAKCSDVIAAEKVFNSLWRRDVVSWTSIIVGMAQHGLAYEALSLYDEMIEDGVRPNDVTFTGLIYACSHVGLVAKGRSLFKSMVEDYKIKASLQHYTCLLDLYSRSGHLDEAENLLQTMKFEPDEAVWAALLSACKRHGNIEMGVRVADNLLTLGPKDSSTCILLSNFYAGAALWEKVSTVRKLMGSMEIKKEPGYSCVELGKESLVFYAGEMSNPMKDEIFSLLSEFDIEMRRRGYVPDTSWVLHDMEQQEKERQLFWHSERVAVAYGLLKSVPGTVIRIVKNLRICGDCHTVFKYICSIVDREIVVRDATRFHHFKNGVCSCHDFW